MWIFFFRNAITVEIEGRLHFVLLGTLPSCSPFWNITMLMARPPLVFKRPVQHISTGWHLSSYTDLFFNLRFICGEPKGHHKCLFINYIGSDRVVTVALILVICLILSSPTLDNIYWLLDMKDEDLCPLYHPSSQSFISFSIKL